MLNLQVSGLTAAATTTTAGVGVSGLADYHLALQIHRLCGSQKLEAFKTEAGVVVEARHVDLVCVVCSASTDERVDIVTSCCFLLLLPSSHLILSISNNN